MGTHLRLRPGRGMTSWERSPQGRACWRAEVL